MNFLKKLFGVQDAPTDPKQEEEKNFEMFKYDGVRALQQHQFEYAAKCFDHALELNADDLECRDYLSRACIATGDLQKAYGQLEVISQAEPDNVAVWLRMAEVAYMMENYAMMAEACQKALPLDEENANTYFMYAKACKGLDDAAKAVDLLTKAIDLHDDFDSARLLRGNVLLESGEPDKAALDANYLNEHIDGNEDVLLLTARVEKALGNLQEAEVSYGKVIDANPFSIEAYRERGEVRKELGDSQGANADEAYAREMESNGPVPTEGIEESIKQKMQQMDPYKVFHNEYPTAPPVPPPIGH